MSAEERITVLQAASAVRAAQAAGWIGEVDHAVLFHDLTRMEERIGALRRSFPPDSLHALAIKANPLVELLKRAVACGAGLEAASIEEVHLALAAGCAPEKIVFDSPAKTRAELEFALEQGIHINADNLDEIRRIAELRGKSRSRVGLRVNPGVGAGRIAATSVAGPDSRFGVSAVSDESAIRGAFADHPWLECIHVHVGSQGCDPELLVAGAARAAELGLSINRSLGRSQVTAIDIGGGLPTEYVGEDRSLSFHDYAARLRERAPELFGSDLRLITEFGRSIFAGCGFAWTRVEYVKQVGEGRVAVVHLGADFLLRPVYQPTQWQHEYAVFDPDGRIKDGDAEPWTLAGPLCFAGDIIARDVPLPPVAAGDGVLIRDVGAYTMSMWSRHCSRGMPRVLGYETARSKLGLVELRPRETPEDVVRYWSGAGR